MLPAIAYSIGSFVLAALLTCGYTLTRPIHKKDDYKSWRVFAFLFVLCFTGPYLYLELMTSWHGKELDSAIKNSYGDLPFTGPLLYYKVRTYSADQATVMVVDNERLQWGGTDHAQIELTLVKKGSTWQTKSYKIWNSERLNIETYIYPVYW